MADATLGLLLLLAWQGAVGELDDVELARRIHRGDRQGFRLFFERYHAFLLHYLERMGVPPDVAEDLVQQAFLAVWERRAQIDPSRSLRAFLFRIGHNRALNHFRDSRRLSYEAELPELPDPAPGADRRTDATFLRARLHEAVGRLPERRRAVFELCFLQGLTYREAAEVLDISPKTVENQMAQALRHLRSALAGFR
ncbi:RNA polymerase sigma-70 factor [Rhodocaloribacter litoris]|uniref:RNA polymerase sigma factor n=1 Tax=Rhodocaloribacter litoris TaxID=2558931 RepID=UPI001421D7A7|nr:RNA polymerase sigma-70 factor [Rhodocaloribacter litoris]QXD15347.1 RNA polymerase sigma-70 factor [Rhodocaloribacter litoris]